jgi:hypothetical protein
LGALPPFIEVRACLRRPRDFTQFPAAYDDLLARDPAQFFLPRRLRRGDSRRQCQKTRPIGVEGL